jgi:hypothetical protein
MHSNTDIEMVLLVEMITGIHKHFLVCVEELSNKSIAASIITEFVLQIEGIKAMGITLKAMEGNGPSQ